jgi:hypothetical protein
MREPVDAVDATSFSSRLYPELFASLAGQEAGQPVPPDWSGLLVGARRRLAETPGLNFAAAAQQRRQWSLPVLYVRQQPNAGEFTVTRTAAEPAPVPSPVVDMQAALLQLIQAGLGPDAPPALVADLAARLAAPQGGQQ